MVDKTSPLACCTDLYSSPLGRLLLGDSWHPGGLALTRTLAKAISVSRQDRMLDMACGYGASALMLAQVYKCSVEGIDSNITAIENARREAQHYRLDRLVTFVEGDATRLPFPDGAFTAALCECVTTLLADKRAALSEIARVLEQGGRLALSDVTFAPDELPTPLDIPLARALCIPLGMGPEAYEELIEGAGLVVTRKTDCSFVLIQLLDRAESFLGMGHVGSLPAQAGGDQLGQAAAALQCARQLVERGDLGYWGFTARTP